MLNPDCTPGWTTPEKGRDGRVAAHTAHCGCGWEGLHYPSKTKALRAQKEHRFPGPNPAERAEFSAAWRR